jgi:hypothetical protein
MQPPPPPSAPPPAPSPYGSPQPVGYPPNAWVPPPPVSRRKWWYWGCGGCAALALISIAVIVVVFVGIFTSSPLRHFPTEAGASTTSDNWNSSGGQTSEILVITDPHPLQEVETYYEQALHSNGWSTDTHDPAQAVSRDVWAVTRSGTQSQSGTVTFTSTGSTTVVRVMFVY